MLLSNLSCGGVRAQGTSIDYDNWKPGEPNNSVYQFAGVTEQETVTAFNLWCTLGDGDCCATRTCPAWNDNHPERLYTFICEESTGGGH
jgi:hypothetical protein